MDDQSHFYRGVPKDMEDPVLPHPTKRIRKSNFSKSKHAYRKIIFHLKKEQKISKENCKK